ncbi:MAG: hypothetical protein AAF458_02850 [Pseudomonadota bacterium]
MFKLPFWDRFFGPEAEARQLNRDAVAIIEVAREGYSVARTREMALLTRDTLEELSDRGGANADPDVMLGEMKMKHREARRSREQVELTAFTLVIIDLRARAAGEAADPARAAIAEFCQDWAHAADGQEGTRLL